jgi:poly(hydroxyalkanoate) depolymerase family esterase
MIATKATEFLGGGTLLCNKKETLDMNNIIDQRVMAEATRLTRAGRLSEATALLQQILRADASGSTAVDIARKGRAPQIVDATANPDEIDRPPSSPFGLSRRPAKQPFASAVKGAPRLMFPQLSTMTGRLGYGPRYGFLQPPPVTKADIVPEGGNFLEATYTNIAGTLSYKLYIPSGYHGQALPLVIMLHGCSQSPDDFAAGTRMNLVAEEQTCFVVYPAQTSEANPAKCWNWFRPGDQQRGQGEPSLIAGITRQVMRDCAVDPQRVYIGGLSAGAAAAAVMGVTYPDLYAAIGVHSGLAYGTANDVSSAFAAMRQGESLSGGMSAVLGNGSAIPTIVFHGDQDAIVHPRNGNHFIAPEWTDKLQKQVHRGQVPGGHSYTRIVHADASGRVMFERWEIHGAGHAWAGGSPAGSFTDSRGPDAAREMLRFFLEHPAPMAAQ